MSGKIAIRSLLIPKVTLGPSSTLAAGIQPAAAAVGAGSNGGEISTIASWGGTFGGNGVLVLGAAPPPGWPAAGTVNVAASGSTTAVVTYTGISGATLTGCAYVSGSPTGTVATGGAVSLQGVVRVLPYMDFSWADELTFILTVLGTTGSPSGGTLTAGFLLGNPNTQDGLNGTGAYQYSDPAYSAMDAQQKWALIAEGEDWPNPVAAYNSAFPVTVQRTVKNFGAMVDLVLSASTLAGGSSPAFTISGVLIQKGG